MLSRDQVNRKHLAGLVVVIVMIGAAGIQPRRIAAVGAANEMVVQQQLNTKAINQIIGRSGELKGEVYKIGLPRTDLKVSADGESIKAGLALGSWMAFKRTASPEVAVTERMQSEGVKDEKTKGQLQHIRARGAASRRLQQEWSGR